MVFGDAKSSVYADTHQAISQVNCVPLPEQHLVIAAGRASTGELDVGEYTGFQATEALHDVHCLFVDH